MVRILFYAVVLSLPLGTRVLLGTFIPGFHEYEAAFLYANDIALALFLGAVALRYRPHFQPPTSRIQLTGIALALFVVSAFASIFWAPSSGLALYQFARLLLLAGFAFATAALIRRGAVRIRTILGVLAAIAVLQSLLAIAQFGTQSSLGLQFLGEPTFGWRPIADGGPIGGARIFVEGAKVFRPAGTFPHANVLGAYLLVGLVALYYFWIRVPSTNNESVTNKRILPFVNSPACRQTGFFIRYSLMSIALFAVLLGIFLSFSRAAWLVAALATFGTLAWIILRGFRQKHEVFRQAIRLTMLLVAISALLFAYFGRLVLPRATQLVGGTDPSVSGRVAYQNLGVSLIAERPLGAGIGNQVLYGVESGAYQERGMTKVWQWEPIHNFYLLVASEVGVLGLFAFLGFLISLFLNPKSKTLNPKQIPSTNVPNHKRIFEFRTSCVMLGALLLLGFFDHFLWTLQPGRLLLWLIIGIVMGISRARSSTDRISPSEGGGAGSTPAGRTT